MLGIVSALVIRLLRDSACLLLHVSVHLVILPHSWVVSSFSVLGGSGIRQSLRRRVHHRPQHPAALEMGVCRTG